MPERDSRAFEIALADAPRADFYRGLRQELERRIAMLTREAPPAIHTVTPLVAVTDVERLVAFARDTFGARELRREVTRDGTPRCVIRLGDSLLLFAGVSPSGRQRFAALHVYVPDVDVTYRNALVAGALAKHPPQDKPYGARDSTVEDPVGNIWFIATRLAGAQPPVRLRSVTPWLIARDALGLIDFLKRAFSATEVGIHTSAAGDLLHGALSIGDSVMEFGEAGGVPPAAFCLGVSDPRSVYEQALRAGAVPLADPSEQLDERFASVQDPWGNVWHIAAGASFDAR